MRGLGLGLCLTRQGVGGVGGGGSPPATITAPVIAFAAGRPAGSTFDFGDGGNANITIDATVTSGMYWEVEVASDSGFTTALSGEGAIRTETLQIGAQDFITGPEFTSLLALPNGPTYMRLRVSDDSARVSAWSNTLFDTVSILTASTLDPAEKNAFIDLSGGNLTARNQLVGVGAIAGVRSTNARSGKYYFTAQITEYDSARVGIGLCNISFDENDYGFGSNPSTRVFQAAEFFLNETSGTNSGHGDNFVNGDVMMCAFDTTAGKCWFGRNGTWLANNGGNPAAGTGGFAVPSGALYALIGLTPRGTTQSTMVFQPSPASWLPSGFANFT